MSNPYELRFKVLEMARDLEMQRYEQMFHPFWQLHSEIEQLLDRIKNRPDKEIEAADLNAMLDELSFLMPEQPSSDAIKAKATELYEFVERKPHKA